jgi:hypothetical protein
MNVWESFRSMYGGDQHPDVLTVVHNLGGNMRDCLLFYYGCIFQRG